MGLFDIFKKKAKEDKTYIHAVSHAACGPWHQYDVLLNIPIYGWEYMLNWADYMVSSDMKQIDQVTVSGIGTEDKNITSEFDADKGIKAMPTVADEYAMFGLAGVSNMTRGPIKIVWFNQTKMLRFFVTTRNDEFILKYTDTMVGRTFGTDKQMRLLADGIKVEDMILAASGASLKNISDIPPVKEEDPAGYDAYLKKLAARLTFEDKRKILSLIESGDKLMAIKICREGSGAGLKYAKDMVEDASTYITL